jgi:hypothetical protein
MTTPAATNPLSEQGSCIETSCHNTQRQFLRVSEGASEHRNLTKRGSSRGKKNPHKKVVYAIYTHHPNKDAAAEICNKPKI